MYETTVVGTDLSPEGIDAIRWAAHLTRSNGVVHAVHAVEPPPAYTGAGGMVVPSLGAMARLEEEAARTLQEVVEGLDDARIRAHTFEGLAAEVLLGLCTDVHADLLAIAGTHRSILDRMMLPSVTRQLLRRQDTALLVARGRAPDPTIRAILLASDLEDHTREAAQVAESIARTNAATLHVVHVEEIRAVADTSMDEDALAGEDAGRRVADVAATLLAGKAEPHVLYGPVAPTLDAFARANGIDLVVTGTRRPRGLERLLLGSVAARIATGVRTSVLAVPGRLPSP
ncbi:MAG TPA: universal stress protein [Candidatus Thermoplasmatota archaeon]|nr:universal stress protein [Candidatus Thermoplasmatota archaeon]